MESKQFYVALDPPVQGFLYSPAAPNGDSLVITHGAGSNCDSALLVAFARGFARAGLHVLLCNLPFRQSRPTGPPFPAQAERDRHGLRNAAQAVREVARGRLFLGGHSYGGRQATMLAAGNPAVCNALFILSYPLHPPKKPQQLRIDHLPQLKTPVFFAQGSRDPFAAVDEMEKHTAVIPAAHRLEILEGSGHDLLGRKPNEEAAAPLVSKFLEFTNGLCG